MFAKTATMALTTFTFAASLGGVTSALAAHRHHRHDRMSAPAAQVAGPRDPDRFYPNEIDGGVSGNLPFNNQIRKMRDPLNANGAGK